MKVRMTRYVESFVQVRDLLPGEVIDLPDGTAAQFIANGMAESVEPVGDPKGGLLEAATLGGPRRRG